MRDASRLQYVSMYGEMGKQSNTMIFSDKPADINALLAQAAHVISSAVGSKGSKSVSPLFQQQESVHSDHNRSCDDTSSSSSSTTLASYTDLLGDKYKSRDD